MEESSAIADSGCAPKLIEHIGAMNDVQQLTDLPVYCTLATKQQQHAWQEVQNRRAQATATVKDHVNCLMFLLSTTTAAQESVDFCSIEEKFFAALDTLCPVDSVPDADDPCPDGDGAINLRRVLLKALARPHFGSSHGGAGRGGAGVAALRWHGVMPWLAMVTNYWVTKSMVVAPVTG